MTLPVASAPETDLERTWLLPTENVYRGNIVQFLSEGAEYFEQWFFGLKRVRESGTSPRRLLHIAWRLADVSRLGRLSEGPTVVDDLRDGALNQVDIRLTVAGHAWGVMATGIALRLRRLRGVQSLVDMTAPTTVHTNHMKVSVFEAGDEVWALVGSIDLAPTRFEREHGKLDPHRYRTRHGPSHDLGIKIVGSGAVELQRRFAMRWSALCQVPGRRRIRPLTRCTSLEAREPPTGVGKAAGSSLQIVETIPARADTPLPRTTTLGQLYRKTLSTAEHYIYIEDQYFQPHFRDTALGHDLIDESDDILPLLDNALSRGVFVIVLLPDKPRRSLKPIPVTRRRRDAALRSLLANPRASERLVVLQYKLPQHHVHVHSKLLIADDSLLLVGSANVNRRGMFSDFEIGIGVLDPLFVRATRIRLWSEHAGASAATLSYPDSHDPEEMVARLRASARLRRYEPESGTPTPGWLTSTLADRLVDPPR